MINLMFQFYFLYRHFLIKVVNETVCLNKCVKSYKVHIVQSIWKFTLQVDCVLLLCVCIYIIH